MTLVVLRFDGPDMHRLRQQFDARRELKVSDGCISSRLLVDTQDPTAAVVLMDFHSPEEARTYLKATLSSMGADDVHEQNQGRLEYLEDAPAADGPISQVA